MPSLPQSYAPQARVVDGLDGTTVLAATTTSDLVSVRVTQTNSGISEASITLSNVAADARSGGPTVPAWSHDSLSGWLPGTRVRIDFGYAESKEPDQPWRTLFFGRLTGCSFSFGAGVAQMTVECQDLLSLLNSSDDADKNYHDQEVAIVNDVLERSGTDLTLAEPQTARRDFSARLASFVHRKRTSYLQCIQGMADRMDYEVFADCGTLDEDGISDGEPEVHFEPARSLKSLTSTTSNVEVPIVDLHWGGTLLSFNPRIKVGDVLTSVSARGRDPARVGGQTATATDAEIDKDLRHEAGKPAPLSASAFRQRWLTGPGEQATSEGSIDGGAFDADRIQLQAAAELRKKAREFLTAEGEAIGQPTLIAGVHINLTGMSAPFDGIYYVTRAVHSIDGQGYRTQFTVRRPGMLDPDTYNLQP